MHFAVRSTVFIALLQSALCWAKPVLNFDNGEISPVLASSIEKSGAGQYTLHFSNPALPLDKVKAKLQNELREFPQLKLTVKGRTIVVDFKGPDTYLLKALSRIDAE